MKTKCVIFDLDGTLVDTVFDVGNSINKALALEGFPPKTIKHYKAVMGTGILVLISKCVPEKYCNDERILERVHSNYEKIYGMNYCANSKPYDDILFVLNALKKNNYTLAVLSNKTDKFTKEIVQKLFGEGIFSYVAGRKDGVPLKPNPTAAIEIARNLGFTPEETMYVGDSEVDIATAHNSNMIEATVTWGFRSVEELLNAGARQLVNTPKEILKILKKQ